MTEQVSDYRRIVDSFEAEEGYPTDAWIDAFNALPQLGFSHRESARFLVEDLPNIAQHISCMAVGVVRGTESVSIKYITGGWSGADDLIRAMLRQFWIHRLHCKWERGGAFYFDVPLQLLNHQSAGQSSAATNEVGGPHD